jgi:hypothetical protein
MEINPAASIASSIQDMGQVLRQMADAKLALDDKMLKTVAAEMEQAAGTSAAVDTYA